MELTRNVHVFTVGLPGSRHLVIRIPGHVWQFHATHIRLRDIKLEWR